MTEVWTNERVGHLRTLFADPVTEWSFSEMAAKLGAGLSRNAVIGKAHRLGLDRRRVGRKPKPLQIKPARKSSAPLPPGAPKFNAEIFVCAEAVDIVPRHLSLSDLEESDCRYPYGDGPFTFCGHPKQDGSSYCTPHHRLCAAGIPARKNVHATAFGQSKGGVFGRVA